MSNLLVTCHAATRAEAVAFLEAVQIAAPDENGDLVSIADAMIHPFRANEALTVTRKTGQQVQDEFGNLVDETEIVPGHHFNIWFYGDSLETLTKPEPEGGWLPEHDLFDRYYILELVEGRTGQIPGWQADANDPVPPGYAVGTVRAFDPALISSPSNVRA